MTPNLVNPHVKARHTHPPPRIDLWAFYFSSFILLFNSLIFITHHYSSHHGALVHIFDFHSATPFTCKFRASEEQLHLDSNHLLESLQRAPEPWEIPRPKSPRRDVPCIPLHLRKHHCRILQQFIIIKTLLTSPVMI